MAKGFYFECDFCGEIVKTDMSASLDTESWDVDLPEGWLTMQTPYYNGGSYYTDMIRKHYCSIDCAKSALAECRKKIEIRKKEWEAMVIEDEDAF